jgi:hypothetical protein
LIAYQVCDILPSLSLSFVVNLVKIYCSTCVRQCFSLPPFLPEPLLISPLTRRWQP